MTPPQLLTVAECAEYLRRSVAFVRKRIKEGNIKAYRGGKGFLIPVEAIDEYLNRRRVSGSHLNNSSGGVS